MRRDGTNIPGGHLGRVSRTNNGVLGDQSSVSERKLNERQLQVFFLNTETLAETGTLVLHIPERKIGSHAIQQSVSVLTMVWTISIFALLLILFYNKTSTAFVEAFHFTKTQLQRF